MCARDYNFLKFFQYTQLLSTVTVIETVGVIIAIVLYPFMERHIWNVMQDTIDECDVTSIAYDAIVFVQMVVSRKFVDLVFSWVTSVPYFLVNQCPQ